MLATAEIKWVNCKEPDKKQYKKGPESRVPNAARKEVQFCLHGRSLADNSTLLDCTGDRNSDLHA